MSEGTHRRRISTQSTPPYIAQAEKLIEDASQEIDRNSATHKYEAALQTLQTGLGSNRPSLADFLARAEVHWELTNAKDSIDCLKEAIQIAPKDPRPYALLGRYLLYKGLRDQAMNFLDRAIQLDPKDFGTKKLRDRATLQQKKNYAVVVNATDTSQASASLVGAEAKHKQEATRLMQMGKLSEATEELSRAQHGTRDSVDNALAALLGASIGDADVSTFHPESRPASASGNRFLASIVVLAVFLFVLAIGILVQNGFAASGGPHSGLAVLIAKDQVSTLQEALFKIDEEGGDKTLAQAALISAVLLHDHGAEKGNLDAAETYLGEASSEQKIFS